MRIVVSGMIAADPAPGRRDLGRAPVPARPAAARPRRPVRRAGRPPGCAGRSRARRLARTPPTSATWRRRFGLDRTLGAAAGRHAGDGRAPVRASCERPPASADLLVNISGILTDERSDRLRCRCASTSTSIPPSTSSGRRRASTCASTGHTHFVTVGQAIGTPACPVPTLRPRLDPDAAARRARAVAAPQRGRRRRASRRSGTGAATDRSSTTESTTGRRPTRCGTCMALPDAHRRALPARARHPSRRDAGPRGARPQRLAARRPGEGGRRRPTPTASSSQSSRGELGVAKSGYVLSRCGWFSDRSACYLASGRPVLAQETGFDRVPADRRGAAGVHRRGRGGSPAIERIRVRLRRATPRGARPGRGAPRLRPRAEPPCSTVSGAACDAAWRAPPPSDAARPSSERALGRRSRGARAPAVRLPDELRARGARRRARGRRAAAR